VSKKRTVWVLDTETKGTGAEMVPLERLEERKRLRGRRRREPIRVIAPEEPGGAQPVVVEPETERGPRRFKVMDVLSRQVLADNVGLAEALAALRELASVVDAKVYVWESDDQDWRPLTMSERRTLWGFRHTG
jgi:hypothetical protein